MEARAGPWGLWKGVTQSTARWPYLEDNWHSGGGQHWAGGNKMIQSNAKFIGGV